MSDLRFVGHQGEGYVMLMRGDRCICDDGPGASERAAWFASMTSLSSKSVAWIGGGMFVGPKLFDSLGAIQTVFEIEHILDHYRPYDVRAVYGDYRTTLTGKYDVVIYDLGGDVPYDFLTPHLNPGGLILPKE